MKPFHRAVFGRDQLDAFRARYKRAGLSPASIEAKIGEFLLDTVYRNDQYQVYVRPLALDPDVIAGAQPGMVSLSIKRHDRAPIRDWRVMQEIKNMIVGPECEAVEIYPAESRLVDTANQYWLWAFTDPTVRFPFGFDSGRKVFTPAQAALVGAVQR